MNQLYIYLLFIVATMTFNQSSYSVDENIDSGKMQITLHLSNPSSTDINVQIRDRGNGSATSKSFLAKLLLELAI